MTNDKPLSRSRALGAKLIFATFKLLKEAGGQLSAQEIFEQIPKVVDLTDWDLEVYKKTGNVRWRSILSFHTIGPIKAGFLIKKKGIWSLTDEGEEAISLGEKGLIKAIHQGYREWKYTKQNVAHGSSVESETVDEFEDSDNSAEITIEQAELLASTGIKDHINSMNPYEFQDLVAALLRGMGYHTPFIAPRGKDGGIDIVAYRDPLGTTTPRIKVQVKHKGGSSPVNELRQLMGLLQKSEDVGIFVSTGGFSPDAKSLAKSSHVHVELIDLDRLIALWEEFYPKLTDDDKTKLPLKTVSFLAPDE